MSDKTSCGVDEQRAADLKVRRQDYMVISLGLFLLVLAKVMA